MQKIHNESPNVRVQSLPISQNELGAWQNGSVHVRTLLRHSKKLMDEKYIEEIKQSLGGGFNEQVQIMRRGAV